MENEHQNTICCADKSNLRSYDVSRFSFQSKVRGDGAEYHDDDDEDEDALLNAHLQHVGDVLCGLYPVLPGAHHVDGLRELCPEVRRELLGQLVAGAGAHLGVGHLHTGPAC